MVYMVGKGERYLYAEIEKKKGILSVLKYGGGRGAKKKTCRSKTGTRPITLKGRENSLQRSNDITEEQTGHA